jgi:hypothetical protein
MFSLAGVDASQASSGAHFAFLFLQQPAPICSQLIITSGSPSRVHTALSLTAKEQQASTRHDGQLRFQCYSVVAAN